MRFNSKVTWGLAWAGLALVVAVPSMDLLTGKGGGQKAATMTSDMDAVKTASTSTKAVETTRTATTKVTEKGVTIIPAGTPVSEDPVDKLLAKGKKLPSYISEGDKTVTAEPAKAAPRVVVPATTSTGTDVGPQSEPTEVASIDPNPEPVAPQPYPLALRPHGTTTTTESTATVTSKPATVKTTPAAPAATAEKPLVLDETAVAEREEIDPTPTGDIGATNDSAPARWDSESLAHYLARKGLLDDASQSQASVTETQSGSYDADGFFLSDGPNGKKIRPPAPIGDDEPPGNFSLF